MSTGLEELLANSTHLYRKRSGLGEAKPTSSEYILEAEKVWVPKPLQLRYIYSNEQRGKNASLSLVPPWSGAETKRPKRYQR